MVLMALHAMWVHGTSVRPEWVHDNLQEVNGATWDSRNQNRAVPWSNVNGLPRGWGATFRGKRAFSTGVGGSITITEFHPEEPFPASQKGYWFHFAIPTPVIVEGIRSQLQRVFVLWEATPNVAVWCVHIYDGINRIATLGTDRTGSGHSDELVEGVTMFTLPTPHEVQRSIGLSVGVAFIQDGEVTFNSAGADFEV
jgi:hypothetical protein